MSVRFRYFYRWSHEGVDKKGNAPSLLIARNINDLPIGDPHPFYMLSGALSDFPAHHPEHYEEVLEEIGRLERGEIDSYETGGNGFCHSLTRTHVVLEHAVFGECPEWPLWTCTLAQYKAALQGWKQFLQLPKSIDSELVVVLPDASPLAYCESRG